MRALAYNRAMPSFHQLAELREQLRNVELAIDAAASGQSYSIGGRTLTRQNLPELRDQQTKLQRDIKRTESVLEGVRDPSVAIATWR